MIVLTFQFCVCVCVDNFKASMIKMYVNSGFKRPIPGGTSLRSTNNLMMNTFRTEIVECTKRNFTNIALLVAKHMYGVKESRLSVVKEIVRDAVDFSYFDDEYGLGMSHPSFLFSCEESRVEEVERGSA